MNILVTGGSGSIGSYVLRELIGAGHNVTSYSRTAPPESSAAFVQGDIMDAERMSDALRGQYAVVHLVAITSPYRSSPQGLFDLNMTGLVNVLEAMVKQNVSKFVFASSGAATGFSFQQTKLMPEYLPLDEAHPCAPEDMYGLSKLLGELTCKRYSTAYGIQTISLRINHNWCTDRAGAEIALRTGWAKNFSSVEDLWTKRYLKCLYAADDEWGAPGPPAPWNLLWAVTDSRDAAQAFRLAVESNLPGHEVFQINGSDTCSLTETRALIQQYYPGVPLKQELSGFASAVSHDKATRQLGYRPQYTWRNSDFSEWMKQQAQANGIA